LKKASDVLGKGLEKKKNLGGKASDLRNSGARRLKKAPRNAGRRGSWEYRGASDQRNKSQQTNPIPYVWEAPARIPIQKFFN